MACILSGCSKLKDYPIPYSGEIIIAGNGGGMTGRDMQLHILEDGRVFRTLDLGESFEEIPGLSKQDYAQLKNNFFSLGFYEMALDEPGNRYKYIIFKDNKITHKIQWGKEGVDAKLPDLFYSNIMALVKSKAK
jgi:hypothetical protein